MSYPVSLFRPALALGLALLGAALPASAATFTVSNLNDTGAGSLRQALATANASSTSDLITFSPTLRGKIILRSSELLVKGDVTIQGPGAKQLILSGNISRRLFNVTGKNVTISGLTLANGRIIGKAGADSTTGDGEAGTPAYGGALYNTGSLSLSDIAFIGNNAIGGAGGQGYNGGNGGEARGGAVFNLGTLQLTNVVFQNNAATGGTGGKGRPYRGRGHGTGGFAGVAVGGALFNGGTLWQNSVTAQNNSVKGRTAIEPNIHDVPPVALAVTFSTVQRRSFEGQLYAQGDLLTTYSLASPLPSGLFFNASTHSIHGTPSGAGRGLKASFRVSDGFRTSPPATITFDIAPAESQSLVVTTLSSDSTDIDNLTSLDEAIAYAKSKPGPDTITFALPASTSPVINLSRSYQFDDPDGVTIGWEGQGLLTLAMNIYSFYNSSASLNLQGLKITGYNGEGSAIDNSGTLNLSECIVSNNAPNHRAPRTGESAIKNTGTLTINRSTLCNNAGRDYNTGVISNGGKLTLTNSTFYSNKSEYGASTISSDDLRATLSIDSCTFTANSTDPIVGGTIHPTESSNVITNSLIVGNQAWDLRDQFASWSRGYTITNSIVSGTAKQAGLQTDAQGRPRLLYNGGLTSTVALLPTSRAVNAGATSLATDQRGQRRPSGSKADIGAFEVAPSTPATKSSSANGS